MKKRLISISKKQQAIYLLVEIPAKNYGTKIITLD